MIRRFAAAIALVWALGFLWFVTALPQPAAAPTAAPAQGGAGKMATMDQVRQIAAAKGLKQTQVIDGLKKAGYTIR